MQDHKTNLHIEVKGMGREISEITGRKKQIIKFTTIDLELP